MNKAIKLSSAELRDIYNMIAKQYEQMRDQNIRSLLLLDGRSKFDIFQEILKENEKCKKLCKEWESFLKIPEIRNNENEFLKQAFGGMKWPE